MLYLLFAIAYLLDIIILVFFIALILGLFKQIKLLGEKYTLAETLKIAPELILDKSAATFDKYAKKNKAGTYQASFDQHRKLNRVFKRVIQGALGFFALKIVIVSLILVNIPRPGEAELKQNQYLANDFLSFTKGQYTLTAWQEDGIIIQPGQLAGSYISSAIGAGQSLNQWQSLTWQTDKNYNQKPEYPKETIAVWGLDTADNCTAANFANYKCQSKNIDAVRGLYYSSAYNFDGYNSRVKIPQNITFKGSFTIGAWINPSVNIIVGSEDQNFAILTKAYGDYSDKKPYELKYNYFFGFKNGALSLIFWPDGNKDHWVMGQNNKFNFEPSQWYHVAGVYNDKEKTIKIYVDSIEQTNISADWDGNKINYSPNTSKDNFPSWIGSTGYRWQDGEEKVVNIFKGSVDEVFLTNSAMNIMDIRNLITQAGEIAFQVRTGDYLPLNGPFWGPAGKTDLYFTNTESNNFDFIGQSKYLQYIAYLFRPNTNFSPKLNSVSINYLAPEELSGYKFTIVSDNDQISAQLPAERDQVKEQKGIEVFVKFFQALPQNDADWEFVHLVAYNKVSKRNLDLEIPAVAAYIKYLKKIPVTDSDWGLVKALAYSAKGAELLGLWQKLK